MFLHIGNNNIINRKNIIGIFNIKTMENTKEYKDITKHLEKNNNLQINDIDNKKTLLLTEDKNKLKGYITNISSITLSKRLQKL